MASSNEPVTVVVYCDGTATRQHLGHPIAAYRLVADGWWELQVGTWHGTEFQISASSVDQVTIAGPIARDTVMINGREYFDPDAYEANRQAMQQHDAQELRIHYRWTCPVDACSFDLDVQADPMHRMFHQLVDQGMHDISLAQVDALSKRAATLRKQKRR